MATTTAKPRPWRATDHVRHAARRQTASTNAHIAVRSDLISRGLLIMIVLLGVADVVTQTTDATLSPTLPGWVQAVKLVDLDREFSFPTWYSIILLALASALLGLISWAARRDGDRLWIHWSILAVIFAAMSIDEQILGHESVGQVVGEALDTGGLINYAWVLPGTLVAGLLGLAFIPFLRAQRPPLRAAMILAAGFYLGGALGVEAVSGVVAEREGVASLLYASITSVEETFELLGVSIFLLALLDEAGRRIPAFSISFEGRRQPHDAR